MLARAKHVLSVIFQCDIKKHPANLPISLTRNHLLHILPYGYVVSRKADGSRVYLFHYQDMAFLLHRNMEITLLTNENSTEDMFYVFDGELLSDGRLLLFDTLVYHSMAVIQYDYLQRYEYVRLFCSTGQFRSIPPVPNTVPSRIHFEPVRTIGTTTIMPKPVFTTDKLSVLPTSHFMSDGLIFTKLRQSYMPYRSAPLSVIKYKLRVDMTIDMYVNNRSLSVLREDGTLEIFAVTDTDTRIHKQIWECGLLHEKWVLLKHRTDKVEPNSLHTALATMDNIREDIQLETVVNTLSVK